MNESMDTAVLAIDGGGTRCRIACDVAGRVTRVETGSANVYTDFDEAIRQIKSGLSQLAAEAGIDESALAEMPVFVGLAGAISEAILAGLRSALPFASMRIDDDRPAAVRGALGLEDGAIIHCGTGSFFALQKAGQIRLAGGWGPVLGDEASAKWIGCTALNNALRVVDGTLPESAFARELIAQIGGIEATLSFGTHARPPEFGSLAPQITQAAARGDAFGRSIMQQGAAHVVSAITALGWQEGMTLCLTGGAAPLYRPHLPPAIVAAVSAPKGEPLDGALSLAREIRRRID